MSFFKEFDKIIITWTPTGEDLVLAEKTNNVWICCLCPTFEEKRVTMLSHVKEHVQLK